MTDTDGRWPQYDAIGSALRHPDRVSDAAAIGNLAALRHQIDACARGDVASAIALISPDVAFSLGGPEEFHLIEYAIGRDAVLEALRANVEALAIERSEIQIVTADGDLIMMFGHVTGNGKGTGLRHDVGFTLRLTYRRSRLWNVQVVAFQTQRDLTMDR